MNNSLQNLQEAETPHMETFSNSPDYQCVIPGSVL